MSDVRFTPGPWYCPGCGRTCESTAGLLNGEPACPYCGGAVEEQGTGDDDPEPA